MIRLTFQLPPRELSPNYTVGSRGARLGKAAKIKRTRGLAKFIAFSATRPEQRGKTHAKIVVRWFHRTMRFPDKDNVIAWLKPYFDGIADAGVVTNDRVITYLPVVIEKDKENPRVEIEIHD